ncbi:MAG: hypothetical protein J6V89_03995 [Acetobacter sp.]|nr:hypothetical protein [Acetobacter sp.]
MAKQTKDTEESVNKLKNLEGNVKDRIADNFFKNYKRTILGNIDFTIADKKDEERYYLWAEAKQQKNSNLVASITQLVLTIYKGGWRYKVNKLPNFLGAFDSGKIVFIPYENIKSIFWDKDFNWNVRPSDHNSKEFKLLYEIVDPFCKNEGYFYNFNDDERKLKQFIANNFNPGTKIIVPDVEYENAEDVFLEWMKKVKDTIEVPNWGELRKIKIEEGDFFLADLFFSPDNNESAKEEGLFTIFDGKRNEYVIKDGFDLYGGSKIYGFKDNQESHKEFWKHYNRPPKELYWDNILDRRDRFLPQDIREREGAYYTPSQWVKLSQKYIADVLGEKWQDEYYVWDCAAGTGNLLKDLTNSDNLFASTLYKGDVNRIKEKAQKEELSLLGDHIFQFDFLNDDLNGYKVPDALKEILNDTEKRKKLIIYINPPFGEAATLKTKVKTGKNKTNVAVIHKTYRQYFEKIGIALRELYAQFLIKIYHEISGAILAPFSTLKILQSPNFAKFRQAFCAELKSLFVVPSYTFDNVKGKFPIGFFIWDTNQKGTFQSIQADIFDKKGEPLPTKTFKDLTNFPSINDWIIKTRSRGGCKFGFMNAKGADFQNNNANFIVNDKSQLPYPRGTEVTAGNFIEICIYIGARCCYPTTWLNDYDQFLHPDYSYLQDTEFQNNCLIFTLFHDKNRISIHHGINHWIPFTAKEVGAPQRFQSDFMTKFINGKYKPEEQTASLLPDTGSFIPIPTTPLHFSEEATAVFNAGREIWRYYHQNNKGG